MPFDRELRKEEINHINEQLSAGTHTAILLVHDGEYGYYEFAGAFNHLWALLSAWNGTSEGEYFLGKESGWVEGIFFIYSRNRTYHDKHAKVKIVPVNTVLSRGP